MKQYQKVIFLFIYYYLLVVDWMEHPVDFKKRAELKQVKW